MSGDVSYYVSLIDRFTRGEISAVKFQEIFLDKFKNEDSVDGDDFLILDELFADLDAYTEDSDLLRSNPQFYLDLAELKVKANLARDKLSAIG